MTSSQPGRASAPIGTFLALLLLLGFLAGAISESLVEWLLRGAIVGTAIEVFRGWMSR